MRKVFVHFGNHCGRVWPQCIGHPFPWCSQADVKCSLLLTGKLSDPTLDGGRCGISQSNHRLHFTVSDTYISTMFCLVLNLL